MKKTLLILVLLFSTNLYSQDIQCKEDGNQMEMNRCAYEDFEKADNELNKVYGKLRTKKKGNKLYLKNLKASQNLWIKFRDAELEMLFSCKDENIRMCFGSMYPLLFNGEKARITEERTVSLKNYLKEEEL